MLYLVFHDIRMERGKKETDLLAVKARNRKEAIEKAKAQSPERGEYNNYSAMTTKKTADRDVILLFKAYDYTQPR